MITKDWSVWERREEGARGVQGEEAMRENEDLRSRHNER